MRPLYLGVRLSLGSQKGEDLLKTLAELTGIPHSEIESEIGRIVEHSGNDVKNLTLEDLRSALVQYLDHLHAGEVAIDDGVNPDKVH